MNETFHYVPIRKILVFQTIQCLDKCTFLERVCDIDFSESISFWLNQSLFSKKKKTKTPMQLDTSAVGCWDPSVD